MKTFIKSFLADESGASAAEYALILVVVGIGIVGAGAYLAGSIEGAMEQTADIICDEDDGNATTTDCANDVDKT
jgi:pilus assembly protein Flp/PilA